MGTILSEIAAKTKERIEHRKREVPVLLLKERIAERAGEKEPFLFEKNLKQPGLSFICEVKKASPSKGVILETFPYLDPYMIYEAKAMRADAVLLICAILREEELMEYLELAEQLGLSALVEAHSEEEVEMAKQCRARVIGVNNRDLHTFQVDLETSIRMRDLVPPETVYVSESGIRNPEDVRLLRENGTDAILIGETLMRATDKRKALDVLRGKHR